MSTSKILDTFLALCPGYEMPELWRHVPVGPDIRQTCACPADVTHELVSTFDRESLLASRVLVPNETGELQLSPWLSIPDAPLIGLRDVEQGALFDLLTPAGPLLHEEPSLFTVLRDRETLAALRDCYTWNEYKLFVAVDLQDVIVLRSAGLAATLADHLEHWNEPKLQRLSELFGFTRPLSIRDHQAVKILPSPQRKSDDDDPDSDDAEERNDASMDVPSRPSRPNPETREPEVEVIEPTITFVGWLPHQLSATKSVGLRPLMDQLRNLDKFRVLDLFDLTVWQPAAEYLERLQFAAQQGLVALTKETLRRSVEADTSDFFWCEQLVKPPLDNFGEALCQLRDVWSTEASDQRSVQRRRQASEDYHRLLETALLQSLFADAIANTETSQRALQGVLAGQSAAYFSRAPMIYAELARLSVLSGPSTNATAQVKELMTLVNPIIAIARELKR